MSVGAWTGCAILEGVSRGVWLEGSKQWVRRGGGEVCACGGVDHEQSWVVWEVVRMMYVE